MIFRQIITGSGPVDPGSNPGRAIFLPIDLNILFTGVKIMTELTYDEIIKEYELVKSKYDLPNYEELDQRYLLSQILMYYYRSPIKNSLLYVITKVLYDKLNAIYSSMFDMLYNSSPTLLNSLVKQSIEEKKEQITQECLNSFILLRKVWKTQQRCNPDDFALMIKEIHEYYSKNLDFFTEILELNITAVENHELKLEKEEKGFYG